jgi:hypothetical protein
MIIKKKQDLQSIILSFALICYLSFFADQGLTQTSPPSESGNCKETQTSDGHGFFFTLAYYVSKIPEAWSLINYLDLKMVYVGKKASQERFHSRLQWVKLSDILLFHPITTTAAIEKTKQRSEKILSAKNGIYEEGGFTESAIEKLLPSTEPIQLVSMNNRGSQFLVIQGQGRIKSLKDSLDPEAQIQVEVSEVEENLLLELQSVREAYIEKGLMEDL